MSRSAIVTVAFGRSTEHLDYTFTSFAMNTGVPLRAIVVGNELPKRRLEGIREPAPVPELRREASIVRS